MQKPRWAANMLIRHICRFGVSGSHCQYHEGLGGDSLAGNPCGLVGGAGDARADPHEHPEGVDIELIVKSVSLFLKDIVSFNACHEEPFG